MSDALGTLIQGMQAGAEWDLIGHTEDVRALLDQAFEERMYAADRKQYQVRVNLQKQSDVASYAGFIVAEGNPTSGPYQGTSFVWFPGQGGSVVALGIGTDGFGADTAVLGRPGHARRLRALVRMHGGRLWVKPDLLDIDTQIPDSVTALWPEIESALRAYSRVLYAAAPVTAKDPAGAAVVSDLLDLFFYEHRSRHKVTADAHWRERLRAIQVHIFPPADMDNVVSVLRDRRFVILEGPPGTGKTRLALQIGKAIGTYDMIQFHPARTYEDFVVGLYPRVEKDQLAFEVRAGDLLRANQSATSKPYLLIIDEINRADLGRVLGEAVSLLEPAEPDRTVRLPYAPPGYEESLKLSPNLLILGTRNTADRTIARLDLAIRRRFAFIAVWPALGVVQTEENELATALFEDVLRVFTEFADDDGLRLVPGHAYFLDPRPQLGVEGRAQRVHRRLQQELLPLLRDYVTERLLGPATLEITGLADRIEARLQEP